MRRLAVFAAVGCIVVCSPSPADDKKDSPNYEQSAEENGIVELTNKERAKENLPPLKVNAVLAKVARAHSENMAKTGMFEHVLDGKTPADRVRASGYRFSHTGENILKVERGSYTLAAIVQGWMDSKPHRANILKDGYTEIGVGIAHNDKGEVYYTQVFARPK